MIDRFFPGPEFCMEPDFFERGGPFKKAENG